MSMSANVVGFGKYSRIIADYLDYPRDYYNNAMDGVELVVECLHCPTRDSSIRLAEALGVDPWNFNTHKIDPKRIDWDKLRGMSEDVWNGDDTLDRFYKLATRGEFTFFYQPHG
jgi:hypothetical protein